MFLVHYLATLVNYAASLLSQAASFIQHKITTSDKLKDGLLTAYGFILPFKVSTGEAALIVGLVNAGVVAMYRYLELRRRDRKDETLSQLQAHVAELEAERGRESATR